MNQIKIKSEKEIRIMRDVGKRHAELNERVSRYIKIGVTTLDIENFARKAMEELDIIPTQIGYHGYPAATCIGINDDGLHCIPNRGKIISDGDIVTFDTVVKRNNYCADGGFTVPVGNVDEAGLNLIKVNKKALKISIETCVEGNRVGDIGYHVAKHIRSAGFEVLKGFVGHGIGKSMHENPQIPNYGIKGKGLGLKEGMTLALDTMVSEGNGELDVLADGWSTKMRNGRLSFFEHTVVVRKGNAEILTKI